MTNPLNETSLLIKKAASLKAKEEEVKSLRDELSSITDTLASPLIEYLDKLPPSDCEQQLIHLFQSANCPYVREFYKNLLSRIEELEKDLENYSRDRH